MEICFVASECTPFIKVGGLADVVGSLPQALTRNGAHCCVVIPLYKKIMDNYGHMLSFIGEYQVDINYHNVPVKIMGMDKDGVTYFFVQHAGYFEREGSIYGFMDDGERFAFFQKAVMELFRGINYWPDVIHCHDWHTGMIPCMLKENYWYDGRYNRMRTIYTVHNLAYQGNFSKDMLDSCLGLSFRLFDNGAVRFDGGISFMKTGILYADKVTTVSPNYAQEILSSDYGEHLEHVLMSRGDDLWGIVNGIDTTVWDASMDKHLVKNYTAKTVKTGKAKNKAALQRQLGLEVNPNVCLVAMVTRLVDQKGIDLVISQMDEIVRMPIQLVILGNGNAEYERILTDCENGNKGKICFYNGYNEPLSHMIYAAADAFLMPSRFEPCGISQLISMRYGTLPIVRETGGLKDTVNPYNMFTGSGNGFSFYQYDGYDMKECIYRALSVYYDNKHDWNGLVQNAMATDVSWDHSASLYMDLYHMLGVY